MTPYQLEETKRKYREQFDSILKRNGPTSTLLSIIFDTQEVILQHLADVEAEASIERRNKS